MRKVTVSLLLALAISGIGISHGYAQITWEKYTGGWSWEQNQTFMSELIQSVHQFFGNAVGAYVSQSNTPLTHQDVAVARPTVPPEKWALISTQFFGGPATGEYSRGTILDGHFRVYAFFTGGSGPVTAFVTPIHKTNIVAAAIVGNNCSALAPKEIGDAAAFKKHFGSKCQLSTVTVFFKDKLDFNPKIRDVLSKLMSSLPLSECRASPAYSRGTLENKLYVSKYGHEPPRCRVPVNVEFLDQLSNE